MVGRRNSLFFTHSMNGVWPWGSMEFGYFTPLWDQFAPSGFWLNIFLSSWQKLDHNLKHQGGPCHGPLQKGASLDSAKDKPLIRPFVIAHGPPPHSPPWGSMTMAPEGKNCLCLSTDLPGFFQDLAPGRPEGAGDSWQLGIQVGVGQNRC